MRKPHATTVPPSCSTSRHSVRAVPPVASRSSWTRTRAPLATASVCSSSASVPYSSRYSARTVSLGSLPGLRASTNPAPSSRASAGPSRNPRASAPMTTSTSGGARAQRPVTAASSPAGSASTGVMSLKPIPGCGKSGISRTRARRSTATAARRLPDDLAQVPDQQQVLEVRRHRGEVLERLDRLLAALGVARAQGRREDLLQQRRLAVGRGPERTQVASADAVAGELGHRAHDLSLGLVVVLRAGAVLALDDAVVLELGDEPRIGARLLDDVVERVQRAARRRRDARAALAPRGGGGAVATPAARSGEVGLGAPRGELLADDAQRQELVALQAQDRPQAGDVARAVEPVAARRAPRREQLLVLEVADLRDRDVRELLLERLAEGADRHRLRRGRLVGRVEDLGPRGLGDRHLFVLQRHGGGSQREMYVSLNLPTCSSSPSSSRCDSIRWRLT